MNADARDFLIREATAADADALGRLLEQLGYAPGRKTIVENLERLAHGPLDRTYVAEREGVTVGLITVHLLPLLHDRRAIARITALVVEERARRRGIGAALVAHAEAFAREQDCSRVEVTSRDEREGAHRFYLNLSYETNDRRFIRHLTPTSWAQERGRA